MEGKPRAEWEPDSNASHCPCCEADFSMHLRKHHCRGCGKVVCAGCSAKKTKMIGYDSPQRICDHCEENMTESPSSKMCRSILLLLGCVDSPEVVAMKERKKTMKSGSIFTRKKGVLFSKQRISVKLASDGIIHCTPMDSRDSPEEYPLVDIGEVCSKEGGVTLTVKSSIGTTIIEMEARNSKTCELWTIGIKEAISEFTEQAHHRRPQRSSQSKAAKTKYFVQKNIELANRKDEAEKKKAKIMGGMTGGGGMKYSALVMSNRAAEVV